MESNNFTALYTQFLQHSRWLNAQRVRALTDDPCVAPAEAISDESEESMNGLYQGLLDACFRDHARRLKRYRGETRDSIWIGDSDEAAQTMNEAIRLLFNRNACGEFVDDPIAFVRETAWACFIKIHPTAGFPEFWSPAYEQLREELMRVLIKYYKAETVEAEQAVDAAFAGTLANIARGGKIEQHALKAYLKTAAINAFGLQRKKSGREFPGNPQSGGEEDTDGGGEALGVFEEQEVMWGGKMPGPDDLLQQKQLAEAAAEEMKYLSTIHQRVLTLTYLSEELGDEEIAARFGIQVGTLKVHQTRAKMALRQRLADRGFGYFGVRQRGDRRERVFLFG